MADSLVQLSTQLTRIVLPMIIVVGVVGNSLNIAVLTRPNLYHHASSRYFLALGCNNLFYSSIILINRLLANGYQLNLLNYSSISCKMITYISTMTAFLSPYLVVFASMDRYWASSTNARIRKLSSIRMSKWMIFIVVAIFSIFFIHILVMIDLQQDRGFTCIIEANTIYIQVYIITQVFLFAVVPPSLMAFFGLMTIHNSNQPRVIPVVVSRYYRTERQLGRMLFLQVTAHILLTLPSSVTYLISVLPNTIRTTIIFSFISAIFQLVFNCSYVSSFFLYLLAGRIYRRQLIRMAYKTFRICRNNQVQPSVNQNTARPTILSGQPQTITSS